MLGYSWGSALGLAYAAAHPERVDAMVGQPIHDD
jgi:pimeloyl-ACP methyl ester carboxylesterase